MRAGTLRSLGNGEMAVYLEGGDVRRLIGPEMSGPTVLASSFEFGGRGLDWSVTRRPGSASWRSSGSSHGQPVLELDDFVTPDRNRYFARLNVQARVELLLENPEGGKFSRFDDSNGVSFWTRTSPFAPIFVYPAMIETYTRVTVCGTGVRTSDESLGVTLSPGRYVLEIAVGATYSDVGDHPAQLEGAYAESFVAAQESLDALLARLQGPRIASMLSTRPDLLELYRGPSEPEEDGVMTIVGQMSRDGGISAGYEFPLAYVRDLFGVSRGLIDLGLSSEAVQMAKFRLRKWSKFGDLANAESMGHDRIRHHHENDRAEVPAYALLQYLDAADLDPSLLDDGRDFLLDCWRVQLSALLPSGVSFNGDETYVAGGFLPRSRLEDGSFESTLLVIASGRRLLTHSHALRLSSEMVESIQEIISRTSERFRTHFFDDETGRWFINARSSKEAPGFRYGVCEQCGAFPTWLRLGDNGRYLCTDHGLSSSLPWSHFERFTLTTPLLSTFLIGEIPAPASSFDDAAKVALGELEGEGSRINGHDPGLILLASRGWSDSTVMRLVGHTLGLADESGTWSERYTAGVPNGCRCRPWETAVNLFAMRSVLRARTAH
jgi:hypothetical protein